MQQQKKSRKWAHYRYLYAEDRVVELWIDTERNYRVENGLAKLDGRGECGLLIL